MQRSGFEHSRLKCRAPEVKVMTSVVELPSLVSLTASACLNMAPARSTLESFTGVMISARDDIANIAHANTNPAIATVANCVYLHAGFELDD
jgi:hypothetical protein